MDIEMYCFFKKQKCKKDLRTWRLAGIYRRKLPTPRLFWSSGIVRGDGWGGRLSKRRVFLPRAGRGGRRRFCSMPPGRLTPASRGGPDGACSVTNKTSDVRH